LKVNLIAFIVFICWIVLIIVNQIANLHIPCVIVEDCPLFVCCMFDPLSWLTSISNENQISQMMEDPDVTDFLSWRSYFWQVLIGVFSVNNDGILHVWFLAEVKFFFPFWFFIFKQYDKMQDRRMVNCICWGICILNWSSNYLIVLMILKTWRSAEYPLSKKGSSSDVLYIWSIKVIEIHHSQLMQFIHITILFATICLNCVITNMENFNVNINDSPNGSSTGSSELSHEALLELCVVGTVLTDKPVRFQFMEERLPSIWRPGQGVTITQAGENRFHFQFYHEWDLERVLQNGPWTFEGFLLVLKKLEIGEAISEVAFNEAEVWVQVFNLPHGYMNEYVGMLLGCHIGRFVKYDESNYYGPWRMYMRIRVALNIAEPLKRSMVFEKEDGTAVNVSFKYERIGVFCYICGLLGHTDSFCPKRLEPGFVDGVQGWGRFLNAGGRTVGGNVTVNKWLRGGRMAARGGRNAGRGGSDGLNGLNNLNENNSNVVVMAQSSEHTLFGRVRVLRGGGFTFHRMVTNFIGQTGGGGGQWIPFELNSTNIANQITIMRLVNGMGSNNGGSNVGADIHVGTNAGSQQSEVLLTGHNPHQQSGTNDAFVLTGCNQRLGQPILSICGTGNNNVGTLGETSEAGRVVCAKKKDKVLPSRPIIAGPLIIREGANVVNSDAGKDLPSDDKGKGKMDDGPAPKIKKRVRPNVEQETNNNAGSANEQVVVQMNIDTGNAGDGLGGRFTSVQTNPLFSENIVMAEAGNQPRQQP
jgi:hypothetical protein